MWHIDFRQWLLSCVKGLLAQWRIVLGVVVLSILGAVVCVAIGRSEPADLDERAEEALAYCKKYGYSRDYCVLVDYGRHSGKSRFFLWDFNKGEVAAKSLCAHGYGKGSTAGNPVFSNEYGSFCSSLGHYRIGKEKTMSKPRGRKALLLYGKDKSNSNALPRGILIHPVHLPTFSIFPFMIPVKVHDLGLYTIRPYSEGCVTIPFETYKTVAKVIKAQHKPVMMWVYE